MSNNENLNDNVQKFEKELKFNISVIDYQLSKQDEYTVGNSKFRLPKKKKNNENINYISHIKINDKIEYIGYLSKNLQKEGFGKYNYENEDMFIGGWVNDEKEGEGVYSYCTNDLYVGQWKKGKKEGKGIYISIEKDTANFFLGNFKDDTFIDGFVINEVYDENKDVSKSFIYKGKVDKNSKKNDDNAIIIENYKFLFQGQIVDDEKKEGVVMVFDDDNKMIHSFKIKAKENEPHEFEFLYNENIQFTLIEYFKKFKNLQIVDQLYSLGENAEDLKNIDNLDKISNNEDSYKNSICGYDEIINALYKI